VLPHIPLIEDLTTGPIPPGSNLLIEFDPASQWYNACLSIAAGWLRQGGKISYNTYTEAPNDVRSKLRRLGVDVELIEKEGGLRIWDWYTLTLGLKSVEKYSFESLKVNDLNIYFSRQIMRDPPDPNWLRLVDNMSPLSRFNDERSWLEFTLTRGFPSSKMRKSTNLVSFVRGLHGDHVYKQLEAAVDGVIEFTVDEVEGETRTMIRIRNMRDVVFDSRRHRLSFRDNFEAALEG